MERKFTLQLWRYNYDAGLWEPIKVCREESAQLWLTAFSMDQPKEHFRLAKKRPVVNPNAAGN